MASLPEPPKSYKQFIEKYPKLGQAWELTGSSGQEGPLDAKTARLVKLAISIGAMREGAIHAGVRKAIGAGIPRESIDQVVALAAGTLGFPATVAVFTWVLEEIEKA